MPWPQVTRSLLNLCDYLWCEFLVAAIALNEVLKFKAREREKDSLVDEDNRCLIDNVNKLDEIIDKQLCDIKRLENIIVLYDIAHMQELNS